MRRSIATAGFIVVIVALGALSVFSTYRIFSHTIDEPAHIAAGIEFLDRGTYTYEQQHPPLARLAAAIGPYLVAGARSYGHANIFDEGLTILYGSADYQKMLSAARFGVLLFFIALVAVASVWAYRDFGAVAAVATAILITTTPPLQAHAGLATTDLPVTATFLSGLFAFRLWLEHPNAPHGLLVGAAVALAVTTKLSALMFLPASFACAMLLRWVCDPEDRRRSSLLQDLVPGFAAGVVAFGLVVWLVYGCPADPLQPFRQLWTGVVQVIEHNAAGHIVFFCGQISFGGFWLFFPTALLVKTPMPFIGLVAFGAFVTYRHHRHDWRYLTPLASAAAILSIVMIGRVNLGIRYVLPLYPLAAMIGGIGVARLVAGGSWSSYGLASLLLVGQLWISAMSRPDYLAYFNFLAGPHPERLLVDSDLDWGQDVNRVAAELQRRHIGQVATALHGNADLSRHGFPGYSEMEWHEPTTGWIVISMTRWAFGTAAPPFDGYGWLQGYTPVATIGKTVQLYYVDPALPAGNEALGTPAGAQTIAIPGLASLNPQPRPRRCGCLPISVD